MASHLALSCIDHPTFSSSLFLPCLSLSQNPYSTWMFHLLFPALAIDQSVLIDRCCIHTVHKRFLLQPVVHFLGWGLMWKFSVHCGQCCLWDDGPGWAKQVGQAVRSKPLSSSSSWPLLWFLPPGSRIPSLASLSDELINCKVKWIISFPDCFWLYCFTIVRETLTEATNLKQASLCLAII